VQRGEFLLKIVALGLQPAECIAVENAPVGVQSAKRANIYCIAICSTVGREILRMEYKKFLHNFIAIPCQIIHGARRLVIRVIGYTRRLEPFFETWEAIRRLRPT